MIFITNDINYFFKCYYCKDAVKIFSMFQYLLPLVILLLLMYLVYIGGKLTAAGTLAGGFVAVGVFIGAGYSGILMLGTFFLLATLATSWKKEFKESLGLREGNKGKRDAGQVLANGGIAALVAYSSIFIPQASIFVSVAIAGALSAATADTLSSELGNVLGRRYINILTLKKDQRGLDGVISLEGTLAGIAGSSLIAFILYYQNTDWPAFFAVALGGLAGNLADSYLGATVERKGSIGNNLVNLINTTTGAIVAVLLFNFF